MSSDKHHRSNLGGSRWPPRRKALGQHHLRREAALEPALRYLGLDGGRVIEIGPGGGVLTRRLLEAATRVVAVELDPAWALHLHRELKSARLQLVVGDALSLDWSGPGPGTAVTGNLPYAISTALIERLLDQGPVGLRAAFLVQLEVAERLVATAGCAAHGSLSVLVAARSRAQILGRVRPGAFVPPPRVMSAFVGLERIAGSVPDGEWGAFKATVRAGFRQRRKTLLNSLAASWGKATARATLAQAKLEPGWRAEALSLEQWLALHQAHRFPPRC